MKQDMFRYDLYRVYKSEKLKPKAKLFMPMQLKFLHCFRKRQQAESVLQKVYWGFRFKRITAKTMIQIPYNTQIGKGFYIGHVGRIIINGEAVLGENINIATGVTIGQESRGSRCGCPVIGDRVWIGTNAVIVGKITIGEDCMIAPNSFVNFDVPAHSIVIGNPARIIHRENATEGYINNIV